MTRARLTAAGLASIAVALGGCSAGGDDGSEPASPSTPQRPPAERSRANDARVIREWSDSLRAGDIEGASRLFAVPATAENGTGRLLLDTAELVRAFNDSLPCGARLVRTVPRGPYTIATFELTGRPGGDCGSGTGGEAATAFLIRRGKIVEWLRVPVPRAPPPRPTPRPQPPPEV